MLKTLSLLLILFFSSINCHLQGQDLHQTDYQLNPLLLSPTQTGAYYGSLRVGAVYRDQFRSFIDQAWESPAAYIDAPISKGFRKNDWIGVGMLLFSDKVGIAELTSAGAYLSAAYHMGLGRRNKQLFTFGVQYGQIRRHINDASQVVFADQLENGTGSSLDQFYLNEYDRSYSDLNIGFKFTSKTSKTATLELGATFAHLLRPQEVQNFLHTRLMLFGNYRYKFTDKVTFEPRLYFNSIKTSTVLSAQWLTHYLFNKEKQITLKGGLGYRTRDAVQVLLGGTVSGWDVGLAFDFTVSSAANPTGGFGGFELGASKIIKIYKTPDLLPRILCPRF